MINRKTDAKRAIEETHEKLSLESFKKAENMDLEYAFERVYTVATEEV
jgi:hypothetical protein